MRHSACDSAESIATPPNWDLEDEQLREVLASPLKIQEREENEGQARAYHSERESLMINSSRNAEVSGKPDAECVQKREANAQRTQAHHLERESLMTSFSRDPEVSGKPDAECVQKREANAQRTQAHHLERESLMTSFSRDPGVSGKPDAVFSCHSESSQNTFSERDRSNEPGNRFESSVQSVFRFADPANVGKSLPDGNKDHLLNQARSELMKQEHQVESLNCCIDELQQQAYAQRLEVEDAHHGYVESRREQFRLRIIYL